MSKIWLKFAIIISLFSMSFAVSAQAQRQPTKREIDQAKKLAGEGERFFRQKNYRQAVERYQRASILIPNYSFPVLYYNKGFSHYALQEYDQALEALNLADSQGYSPQIDIYKIRWMLHYYKKDYDSSLRDAEQVVKVDPNNSTLLMTMGDMYSSKDMNREALSVYQKAAVFAPANGDLQYSIAYNHAKLGDTTEQGVAALKAIQTNTRFLGEAWYLVGLSFQTERKFSEAAEAYEKAITAKPALTAVYNNLSQIYQTMNRYNDAITALKKGVEVSPQDGNLYISLTWLLSLADRHIEAIGAGKKAIEYAPNEYMGYTNLCRAYADAKEYEAALAHCNTALKLKPNDGETNYYLGRIYFFQKKSELASSYYKKSVTGLIEFTKANPDYSDGYYLLGNAYLATSQIPNAILAYRKCLELNPNFAKVIYNLGYSYVLNNDKKSARDQYNLLLSVDKNLAADLLEKISN